MFFLFIILFPLLFFVNGCGNDKNEIKLNNEPSSNNVILNDTKKTQYDSINSKKSFSAIGEDIESQKNNIIIDNVDNDVKSKTNTNLSFFLSNKISYFDDYYKKDIDINLIKSIDKNGDLCYTTKTSVNLFYSIGNNKKINFDLSDEYKKKLSNYWVKFSVKPNSGISILATNGNEVISDDDYAKFINNFEIVNSNNYCKNIPYIMLNDFSKLHSTIKVDFYDFPNTHLYINCDLYQSLDYISPIVLDTIEPDPFHKFYLKLLD